MQGNKPAQQSPQTSQKQGNKNVVDWRLAEGKRVKLHLANGEVVEGVVLKSYKYTYLALVAGRQVIVNKAHIVKVELP
ncbi:MAG: hypothetical protein QXP98_08140 [Thermoproteus sp.]